MKEKIQLQLDDIDIQIADAEIRHQDLIGMLNDKKCVLMMALSADEEIN